MICVVSQCKALSLVLFDTPDNIELVRYPNARRPENFNLLQNGDVDVLVEPISHTMGRDVYHPAVQSGLAFSVPFLYSGGVFIGVTTFVDCAEQLDTFTGDCRDLKVCTLIGSTYERALVDLLPGGIVVPHSGLEDVNAKLANGTCNVVMGMDLFDSPGHHPTEDFEKVGFKLGTKVFSFEVLSLVTRENDLEWSSLVNLVVNAFVSADAADMTQENASLDTVAQYLPNSPKLAHIISSIISHFGNYGNLLEKYFAPYGSRIRAINDVYSTSHHNTSGGGLLRSVPFGDITARGPAPAAGSTLQTIIDRGYLLCGVRPRMGFAYLESNATATAAATSWAGFDVEFCQSLAAAIFRGNKTQVKFVNASSSSDDDSSTTTMYTLLANGAVDVVAGARVTLEAGFLEPTTNRSYKFSIPYFYDQVEDDTNRLDAYALMTRNNDPIWSDFVYWIVMGLIYAEENQMNSTSSTQMPVVSLFGENLKQMFRDCIYAMGSYGDIYSRNLESMVPRTGGPNMLNKGMGEALQYPIPFS